MEDLCIQADEPEPHLQFLEGALPFAAGFCPCTSTLTILQCAVTVAECYPKAKTHIAANSICPSLTGGRHSATFRCFTISVRSMYNSTISACVSSSSFSFSVNPLIFASELRPLIQMVPRTKDEVGLPLVHASCLTWTMSASDLQCSGGCLTWFPLPRQAKTDAPASSQEATSGFA